MRKYFFILLGFAIIFLGKPAGVFSKAVPDASVTIFIHCAYELKPLGDFGDAFIFEGNSSGVGFLVGHKDAGSIERVEQIITAGHMASCEVRPGKDFPGYEVLSSKPAELTVVFGAMTYPATVKKVLLNFDEGLQNPDKALVEVRMPRSVHHDHIPLIKRYTPAMGDEVFIIGFVPKTTEGGTILRRVYKKAFIESVFPAFIQVGLRAFPGMSGSPVAVERRKFFRKKKYAVGTVSMNDSNGSGYLLDLLFATKLDRDFLK